MKYLLVMVLSFVLHKGLEETYEHYYEKAFMSDVCKQVYKDALNDKYEPAPLSKRFRCTRQEMGLVENLSYLLARPHFTRNENNGKWYY